MIKPIKNKKQHKEYLKQAYDLMQINLKPNSVESDKLEILSIVIEQYEKENYPVEPPHPIEAILFRLDQLNMKKSELQTMLLLGYVFIVSSDGQGWSSLGRFDCMYDFNKRKVPFAVGFRLKRVKS